MSKNKKIIGILLVIVFLLAAIVGGIFVRIYYKQAAQKSEIKDEIEKVNDDIEQTVQPVKEKSPEEFLREEVEALTLEEQVAQMFMITPEQLTGVGVVTAAGEMTRQAIEEYPVGGIVYFRQNLESPKQVKEMLANTQAYSEERIGVTMLCAIDEEGGQVTRIGGTNGFSVPQFPYMSELGAQGDVEAVRKTGEEIGSYLSEYGFQVDFAPDADVLTNLANQVVKYRSFGSDCNLVSQMALAQLEGLQSQGVIGVYKHFPGHGGTASDTHEGYAYTEATLERLKSNELVPFQAGIDAGVQMIMVGHISLPNVTGDTRPATFSSYLLEDLLREEMRFEGVIITDAMNMGAITGQYTPGQAAVEVIKAGVDMILMPEDFEAAYQGILDAVKNGELTQERIEESVYRIWKIKKQICCDK